MAKDRRRRTAYLLSKLQSVSGWRGRLVDRILSERLVLALRRGQRITKADLRTAVKVCFDRELVTVGVDVKNNSAGLLVLGAHGSNVRSDVHTSRQKERLLDAQMSAYLVEVLRGEAEVRGAPLSPGL